jgi:hypothetical protein
MFNDSKALAFLAPALVGLGITGAALASAAGQTEDGPVRCEIRSSIAGGMVSLQGVVESDAAVSGTYRFSVESDASSGSSTIRQGGGFFAGPGEPAMLGQVMLGANGIYDAVLTLDAGGASLECEERVGGKL